MDYQEHIYFSMQTNPFTLEKSMKSLFKISIHINFTRQTYPKK